jgi:Uma2 family endonuclease
MGTMPATQRITADEYLALPYSEERRWVQLVEGELIEDLPLLLHERAGLRELWLVDSAASEVLIFRRSVPEAPTFDVALELERDHTLTSPQLDGFELPLVELFPE